MTASGALALTQRELRASLALLILILLGWAFLLWAVVDMSNPLAQLMMPSDPAWTAFNALAVFAMWAIMMMAMMLPSALPMIVAVARLGRQQRRPRQTWIFAAAYLAIWTLFSVLATALHWGLQATTLITPMMASNSVYFTALLLLVAGAVQFSPLKQACLRRCRTPMGFLLTEWRDGARGAWRMGFKHGLFCLGCCWALMLLLFVAGVMNLAWVAALTAAVLIEKLHPAGIKLGKGLGLILIVAGLVKFAAA